jgi:hypothetical protein
VTKLVITVRQQEKRAQKIEAVLPEQVSLLDLRKVLQAEQLLNSLPTNLRFHFDIQEEK